MRHTHTINDNKKEKKRNLSTIIEDIRITKKRDKIQFHALYMLWFIKHSKSAAIYLVTNSNKISADSFKDMTTPQQAYWLRSLTQLG